MGEGNNLVAANSARLVKMLECEGFGFRLLCLGFSLGFGSGILGSGLLTGSGFGLGVLGLGRFILCGAGFGVTVVALDFGDNVADVVRPIAVCAFNRRGLGGFGADGVFIHDKILSLTGLSGSNFPGWSTGLISQICSRASTR